jgi:hypothetical protein
LPVRESWALIYIASMFTSIAQRWKFLCEG